MPCDRQRVLTKIFWKMALSIFRSGTCYSVWPLVLVLAVAWYHLCVFRGLLISGLCILTKHPVGVEQVRVARVPGLVPLVPVAQVVAPGVFERPKIESPRSGASCWCVGSGYYFPARDRARLSFSDHRQFQDQ
jgi:hypothetical protein